MAYTTIDDPSAFFQVATYSGANTGSGSSMTVTNDGNSDLQPDLVWFKRRNASSDNTFVDSTRGVNKFLYSGTYGTSAEETQVGVGSFDSDGVTLTGYQTYINVSGSTYAAWQWKAGGGTTASNTDGSITSTVQTNTTAGFSIITYTGTGGGETFGHGLGVAPDMWIIKRRDGTGSWAVGFNDANILGGTSKYLILQGTSTTSTYSNFWGSSPASSTVMRIAGDSTIGGSSQTYVAYAFAEKQGYSRFGKYAGNENANGPFVYLGFKPAFIMIKNATVISNWRLFDNKRIGYNVANYKLLPNSASQETTDVQIDMLSNGFKIRTSDSEINSGATHIYMAFAENPFVTSTGIPTTAR